MQIKKVVRFESYVDLNGPDIETYYVYYTDGTSRKYYSEAEMPEDAQMLVKYGNCEMRPCRVGIEETYTDSMMTTL